MENEWLIRRSLKSLVNKQIEQGSWGFSSVDDDESITWGDALEWINSVELKSHGEWIIDGEKDIDDNIRCHCSNCGHSDTHAINIVVPYCWFCGAKMGDTQKLKYADNDTAYGGLKSAT